jgi:RND superfamily putative drug exporter
MFSRLGTTVFRLRWPVLAFGLAFMVFAGVWGTQVIPSLVGGGFDDPASDSVKAAERLATGIGGQDADVVALYTTRSGTVDDPAVRRAVTGALAALPAGKVASVTSYWSTGSGAFVSADRRATFAVVGLRGDDDQREATYDQIKGLFAADGLDVELGGAVPATSAISGQVERDIQRAEMLSFPLLLVLLLVVFGGLVAASLPLAVGGFAILGAFTVLRLLSGFTDISIFALNVVTLLGLGLAIDYALFMVSRFREELAATGEGPDAVAAALARTMGTAGRTVAFSGLTVAVSLLSLLVFPQVFLRSMGLGGSAAVLVGMVAALTVLPALLAVLGHRVNSLKVGLRIGRRRGVTATRTTAHGFWYRIASSVMRRPVVYIAVILVALAVLAAPFTRAEFSTPDARALPAGAEARQVDETLRRDFPANTTTPIRLAVTTTGDVRSAANAGALYDYSKTLAALDGVSSVSSITTLVPGPPGAVSKEQAVELLSAPDGPADQRLAGAVAAMAKGSTTAINVTFDAPAQSDAAKALLERIRATVPPAGMHVLVGGSTAGLVDLLDSLGRLLPVMALLMVAVTFVLLFAAFGSVVLPIKAVLMNAVSLAASFGAVVWIFQEGHLAGPLGFTSTGTIDATQPILMLAILFGLSMDYEVFLLSRIREDYLATGDNTHAVATGLQRTGAIITSAALLLMIVIGAFSTSGITFIKLVGVGMFIAILLDATVVRALLVPASMRLMGSANWWAPGPLRCLHERFGFSETEAPPAPPAPTAPAAAS